MPDMSGPDPVDALARMMRNEAYPEFAVAPPPEWSLRAARRILAWLHDEQTTARLQIELDAALAREARLREALDRLTTYAATRVQHNDPDPGWRSILSMAAPTVAALAETPEAGRSQEITPEMAAYYAEQDRRRTE